MARRSFFLYSIGIGRKQSSGSYLFFVFKKKRLVSLRLVWHILPTQHSFLGVNLLSREGYSQTGHRMPNHYFHIKIEMVWASMSLLHRPSVVFCLFMKRKKYNTSLWRDILLSPIHASIKKRKRSVDGERKNVRNIEIHWESRDVVHTSTFIKTTYDISLDSQISLLPRGFSPLPIILWRMREVEKPLGGTFL